LLARRPEEPSAGAGLVDGGLAGAFNSNLIKARSSSCSSMRAHRSACTLAQGRDFFRRARRIVAERTCITQVASFADAAHRRRDPSRLEQSERRVYLLFKRIRAS